MNRWFCLVAVTVLTLPVNAMADEEAAKRLFVACVQAADIFACDELVTLPELDGPTRSNAFTARAMALSKQGDFDAAILDVEQALSIDPGNPAALQVRELIAKMAANSGWQAGTGCSDPSDPQRMQACDQLVLTSPENSPQRAAALDTRAAALMDVGQFNLAIADLSLARKIAPDQPQLVEHLMIAKYWSGDIAGALKENEIALAAPGAEQNGQLHQYRGSLLYLAGKLNDSEREFSHAASMGPAFVIAQYWTGVARIEQGKNADSIFRYLADDPMQGPFANALAKLRLGEASSEDVLREAALLPDTEADTAVCLAHFHIGHQAWLAGDKRKAKEHLTAALAGKQLRSLEYHAAKVILAKL